MDTGSPPASTTLLTASLTGPHLEEVLDLGGDFGLDYFIQLTDARPDTGTVRRHAVGGGELGQGPARVAPERGGMLDWSLLQNSTI